MLFNFNLAELNQKIGYDRGNVTIRSIQMIYQGGCHCGAVRYQIEVEQLEAVDCNCSICTKKGFIHLIVPAARFTLLQGTDALSTYTFNTGIAKHHFCRHCGIHSFYRPRWRSLSLENRIPKVMM